MRKIKWGVIGCGGIARRRTIPGLVKAENAELVSVTDLSIDVAREVADIFGAKNAYDDPVKLLEDPEIEAVYIATPVFSHASLVKLAADYGKQILCEKPLGLNADEAQEVIEYCKSKNVKLAVGLMMRYGTHVKKMKASVEQGRIGQLVSADARFSCWVPVVHWGTTKEKSGGGSLMDMGIHLIDLLRFISGMDVTDVTAMNETVSFKIDGYSVEDSSTLIMRMENGAQFVVYTNFNIPDTAGKWTLNMFGTKGRLLGDKMIGQIDEGTLWELALDEDKDNLRLEPVAGNQIGNEVIAEFGNMYTEEITRFGNAILTGSNDYVDAVECLKDQRIIDAAYESSRTRTTVKIMY